MAIMAAKEDLWTTPINILSPLEALIVKNAIATKLRYIYGCVFNKL